MKKKIENKFCTSFGSKSFTQKFKLAKDAYNFTYNGLHLSSIGFGLYKGGFSKQQRKLCQVMVKKFISKGVNVFDTARKYRNGFSELDLGVTIKELLKNRKIDRNEIFVSSKAGLINFYQDKKKIISLRDFVNHRGLKAQDIKNKIFCSSKKFLKQEIDISLKNLQLNSLDNYYIHNPEFLSGNLNNFKDYYEIFETFEEAIQNKKIRSYGISSWTGFRRSKNSPFYIDIKKIIKIAKEVGGKGNGLKNLQIPLSIYMPYANTNYSFSENVNLLQYCNENKINIFSSATLYEGKIKEFFNLLKIFYFIKNKKKQSINNDLTINSYSLPISDNSIFQFFEILSKISKKYNKFSYKYNNKIYKQSLNFIRSNKFVTTALFGVENLNQLSENVSILKNQKVSYLKQKRIWKILS